MLCPMWEEKTQQNTVQRIPRESPQFKEQKGGNRKTQLLDSKSKSLCIGGDGKRQKGKKKRT